MNGIIIREEFVEYKFAIEQYISGFFVQKSNFSIAFSIYIRMIRKPLAVRAIKYRHNKFRLWHMACMLPISRSNAINAEDPMASL